MSKNVFTAGENNSVKLQPDLTQIKDSGYAKLRHIPPNSASIIRITTFSDSICHLIKTKTGSEK